MFGIEVKFACKLRLIDGRMDPPSGKGYYSRLSYVPRGLDLYIYMSSIFVEAIGYIYKYKKKKTQRLIPRGQRPVQVLPICLAKRRTPCVFHLAAPR